MSRSSAIFFVLRIDIKEQCVTTQVYANVVSLYTAAKADREVQERGQHKVRAKAATNTEPWTIPVLCVRHNGDVRHSTPRDALSFLSRWLFTVSCHVQQPLEMGMTGTRLESLTAVSPSSRCSFAFLVRCAPLLHGGFRPRHLSASPSRLPPC